MFVLIAVYLLHGAEVPIMQHRTYADKDTCQSAAKAFVTSKIAGEPRAFCLKVRDK